MSQRKLLDSIVIRQKKINIIRCKSTLSNGIYSVEHINQEPSHQVGSGNDVVTLYASIANAIQYDDFPNLSIRLIGDYSENLESETTKVITFATSEAVGAKPASSASRYTFTGSIKTNGSMTFTYGTYNISSILTSSTSATINVSEGTMTAITASGNSSVLNLSGGTCTGNITVTKKSTASLNISGGIINGQIRLNSSSGTAAYKISITGGTINNTTTITNSKSFSVSGGIYRTLAIYKTFKSYLQSDYEAVTSTDKTVSVVPKAQ